MLDIPDDPSHPVQIALRTYSLAASLSLAPAVISLASSPSWPALKRILARELSLTGFPFAATLAVSGCYALQRLWVKLQTTHGHLSPRLRRDVYKTFLSALLSSGISIWLLQVGARRWRRRVPSTAASIPYTPPDLYTRPSPTLDLTLLLLVRAIDFDPEDSSIHLDLSASSISEEALMRKLRAEKARRVNLRRKILTSRVDAIVFWLSCYKIMMSWFYAPQRLPSSYVKWIGALAGLDKRLLEALRLLRVGKWSYTKTTDHASLLHAYSSELGFPSSWGDPTFVPAFGGSSANHIWKQLGVTTRPNLGGIPCELVHNGYGRRFDLQHSCTANAGLRGLTAFFKAITIYLPVHFLPVLLTKPQSLLRPDKVLRLLLSASRSATFLSAFIASFYYAVCFTRTLALARLFPFISHNFWDSPYGCILAGSLLCGGSIFIEHGSRRGEMALYVLPRALRAFLSDRWLRNRSSRIAERITFIFSLATLLTAAAHRPDTLRGLTRWTLTFFVNGPNAGFWKKRKLEPSIPPTPAYTPRPHQPSSSNS
ncbi:hypothetical protein DL96DRAFT_1575426 [Flagelloscypha sp. PMI_526]|nr:hypothetical protein DL96DRAFT_1575426 [Flagelloscypha sp. PMI_526]